MRPESPERRLANVVEDEHCPRLPPSELALEVGEQRSVQALLGQLPVEDPGPGFTAGTLARLDQRGGLDGKAPWRTWLAQRPIRLSWALATISVVTLFGLGLLVGRVSRPNPAGLRPVTLVYVAPGARSVHVAGEFNDWQPAKLPMQRDREGVWTVRLTLAPGRYEYMFVVDETSWIADPLAPVRRPDGFGRENAVLEL